MRIKALSLQNIRSYVEETITFPEGSLLLAGDIGAGKSTLLLAIEFAIFGTKRGELEASSLLRNTSHAGKIDLTLDIAGKEIRICRILKRTATTIKQEAGFLVLNGQRQDLMPSELRAKLMDILGYPKDTQSLAKDLLFRYTVFTPQEQMRQILYDDRQTRLNTIRKVFQMDKYKKIIENTQMICKEFRVRKKIWEETIVSLPQLEAQIGNLKTQALENECRKQELHPLLMQVQEKISLLKKDILVLEKQQQEQQLLLQKQAALVSTETMLLQQKSTVEKKYQQLQIQILELQQKEIIVPEKPTEKNGKDLLQELETKQKEMQHYSQQQALLAQQREQLLQQQEQLRMDLASFQNISLQLQDYEDQLTRFTCELLKKEELERTLLAQEQQLSFFAQQLAVIEATEKNVLETKATFEQLDICSLCQQQVVHEHKQNILTTQQDILEKIIAQKASLVEEKEVSEKEFLACKTFFKELLMTEKKKAVLVSVIESTRQKQQQQQEKQQLLLRVEDQMAILHAKQQELAFFSAENREKDITALRMTIEDLQQWENLLLQKKQHELLVLEKQQQAMQCTADVQQIEEQLLMLQQQLSFSGEQLTLFASLEQHLLVLKKTLEETQQQERLQEIVLKTLEKEIEALLQQKSLLEKEFLQKKDVQKKCAALGAYTQWLGEYFAPMIVVMEKQVLLQLHTAFQEFFSKWFTMLMEDNGIFGTIDDEFTPRIEQNGYEVELSDLSGGEKTAVALAYRLALNKVINDFMTTIHTKDLLILDEPTDGFSTEQLEKVRDVLDELQMKQVIIVSHEAKVESFVDHVVRIEKIAHVSRVVS